MSHNVLDVLVEATHESLATAAGRGRRPGRRRAESREHRARVNAFMAATSRHLAAVDETLVPEVVRRMPDGPQRVKSYLHEARLPRAGARAAQGPAVRGAAHRPPAVGRGLGRRTTAAGRSPREGAGAHAPAHGDPGPGTCEALADRVYRAELKAPTRAHPYLPHTGVLGHTARKHVGRRRPVLGHRRRAGRSRRRCSPAQGPQPRQPPVAVPRRRAADGRGSAGRPPAAEPAPGRTRGHAEGDERPPAAPVRQRPLRHRRLLIGGDLDYRSRELAAEQVVELHEAGVTHIIDVRVEWTDQDWVAELLPGLEYFHHGIDDAGQAVPAEWFEIGVQYAARCPRRGRRRAHPLPHGDQPRTVPRVRRAAAARWDAVEALDAIRPGAPDRLHRLRRGRPPVAPPAGPGRAGARPAPARAVAPGLRPRRRVGDQAQAAAGRVTAARRVGRPGSSVRADRRPGASRRIQTWVRIVGPPPTLGAAGTRRRTGACRS